MYMIIPESPKFSDKIVVSQIFYLSLRVILNFSRMKQSCYFNHTQAFMKKTIFKFFRMKQSCYFNHTQAIMKIHPLIINH